LDAVFVYARADDRTPTQILHKDILGKSGLGESTPLSEAEAGVVKHEIAGGAGKRNETTVG